MNESQSEVTGARAPPSSVCHGQGFHAISSASALHSENDDGAGGTDLVRMRGTMHYKILTQ